MIKIQPTIPIAICGVWNLFLDFPNKFNNKELNIVINVIPETDSSKLIIAGLENESKYIETFLSMYNEMGIFGFLNLIEACIIFGTTEWYLTPKVWESKTKKEKEKILNDINQERNGHNYENSIFNTIRNVAKYLII